jgi:alpha-tubulin suppressor-like RCC1 family protein/predicted transcriptional regulator
MVKWSRVMLPLLVFGVLIATVAQCGAASPEVKSVVAGQDDSFVVMDDGSVWAWGDNHRSQLGNLSVTTQLYPYKLPINDVKAMAAGSGYTLALKNDGTVWAWGDNTWGQLGDGTTDSRPDPAQVKGLAGVKAIAAGGGHSLALMNDGTVRAWGRGFRGELGTGILSPEDDVRVTQPFHVDISNVKAIDCGTFHSVALKEDGTVWAWGVSGDGFTNIATPAQVPIADVTAISCGGQDTLALKSDGSVWGWGWNLNYQLGTITSDDFQDTPVLVGNLKDVAQVSAGESFSLAVKRDGTLWAWGQNQHGMLGSGHYFGDDIIDPIQMKNLTGVDSVSAGMGHSLALKSDGTVWAWGMDYEGQIGPISGDEFTDDHQSYFSVAVPRQILFGQGPPEPANSPSVYGTPTPSPTPRPIMNLTPVTVNVTARELWARQYEGPIQYFAEGDNGGLYAFSGNDIYCLAPDGSQKWNLTIPAQWSICNPGAASTKPGRGDTMYTSEAPWPVYDNAGGYLYVYGVPASMAGQAVRYAANPDGIDTSGLEWRLFAISPGGAIVWSLPLATTLTEVDDTVVHAMGDRVYVFHSYNETVIDKSGTVICTIPDIASPVAVDEQGNMYSTPAIRINRSSQGLDTRIASSVLEARSPDGTLLWRKDVGEPVLQQYVVQELRSKYGSIPIYQNGTLYVPVKNGVVALDTNGDEQWSKRLGEGTGEVYRLFSLMPLDRKGNVYMIYDNPFDVERTQIYVIGNDGASVSSPREYRNKYNIYVHTSARDGILYDVSDNVVERYYPQSLNDLMVFTITARDLINDSELWNYTLPVSETYAAVIDENNMADLLGAFLADSYRRHFMLSFEPPVIMSLPEIYLYPGKDFLLVNARSVNYELPLVYGKSKCVYSSGIYALSATGELVYVDMLDEPATAVIATNGTILFGTGGGKIAAVAIGVAAGLALLAALAFGAKFFLFGTIARGRSRLDKNDNRNQILAYARAHPGLTLYELSRCTKINMGTVRYHLFILGVNHKITTFNDGKFVRFFPNSNLYSREEQMIISLIRRETIGKIIQTLITTPGLTNTELSRSLEQPNSAISKLTKELCMRGIAVKEELGDGRADGKYAYSIRAEYAEKTASLSQQLQNDE